MKAPAASPLAAAVTGHLSPPPAAKTQDPGLPLIYLQSRGWSAFADHDKARAEGSILSPLGVPLGRPYAPLLGAGFGSFSQLAVQGGAEAAESGPSWEDIARDAIGLAAPDAVLPPRSYTALSCPAPMPGLGPAGSALTMAHTAMDQLPDMSQLEGAELLLSCADLGVWLANHPVASAQAVYASGSVAARILAMVTEQCGHPAWATAGRAVALVLTILQRLARHAASKQQMPAPTMTASAARFVSRPSGPGWAATPLLAPQAG